MPSIPSPEPVGLLGLAMRIARVEGVMRASSGSAVTPQNS